MSLNERTMTDVTKVRLSLGHTRPHGAARSGRMCMVARDVRPRPHIVRLRYEL